MLALLDGRGPVANALTLVEHEAGGARFMMLVSALADVVHLAVVLVPLEADLRRVFVVAHRPLFDLARSARFGRLVGTGVDQLDGITVQFFGHGLQQGKLAGAAVSSEIVEIHRPDHDAAEAFSLQPFHFGLEGALVVEADPLVSSVSERNLLFVVPATHWSPL